MPTSKQDAKIKKLKDDLKAALAVARKLETAYNKAGAAFDKADDRCRAIEDKLSSAGGSDAP